MEPTVSVPTSTLASNTPLSDGSHRGSVPRMGAGRSRAAAPLVVRTDRGVRDRRG